MLRTLMGWEVGMVGARLLLIPLVAAVGAGLWAVGPTVRARAERRPELIGYARFREAMKAAPRLLIRTTTAVRRMTRAGRPSGGPDVC
ncbi:hypothetical protein GCM10023238_38950 [Streptomyces heliomycini]